MSDSDDDTSSTLPGAAIPTHERQQLSAAILTTPTFAAMLASAPPELDDAEGLAAAAARLVVDASCALSPFGPFLLPPVLLDVALLRTAIGGSYDPHEIPFVVQVAYVAAEQLALLASEHVTIEPPAELDREATIAYPEQMRHETILRLLASAAAAEERVAGLERQLVAMHEPATNPASTSSTTHAEDAPMTPELAQQIFDAMVREGVDPEDEGAVATWIERFRHLPAGERARLLGGG